EMTLFRTFLRSNSVSPRTAPGPLPQSSSGSAMESPGGLAHRPKRTFGSTAEPPRYQDLHRELLLTHKRGLSSGAKPELQQRLEQRRLNQHREQEQALQPLSDLEQELQKRQKKMQQDELEAMKSRQDQENAPEFVRVKEKLRHIQLSEQ
uniref:Zgc:195245 n=1 Tax=Paramormyrops kingsleyae TaxID=1676925 RepID=A0A3B3T978_9TELE